MKAPRKKKFMFGPQDALLCPWGFLYLTLHMHEETKGEPKKDKAQSYTSNKTGLKKQTGTKKAYV